ncbi:phosphatase PAP2 family protein [Streptomyces sp. TS71-3]|uniref:phosphatase PAP2 family protein n=1 Tax=Streptomyces sp. TS71-3 TaxID=2733862 RepID=UPI001B248421|nr:phosphatase PAP2 family protein [Streptomyces sp. TS71-3]GHJ42584.1 hypothetical protein Sm713_81930 [Streptomyces sp. TS71-3]
MTSQGRFRADGVGRSGGGDGSERNPGDVADDHADGADDRAGPTVPETPSLPRPAGPLGARPGLLLLVGLAALVLFAGLATAVVLASGRPLLLDASSHLWSVRHRPSGAAAVARVVTGTGTGAWPYTLVVLGGLLMGRDTRGRLWAAACCLAFLSAGQGLRSGVLSLIARPRPPLGDWATHATNWSFPSGHTATSAMVAGVLISAVLLRSPPGRAALVAFLGCWAVAVAATRIYLGVHWFTDVVGGWFFALAWLCLCGAALRRLAWRWPVPPGSVAGAGAAGHPG